MVERETRKQRKKEKEKRNGRDNGAIKRSYGELGQFLDWPERASIRTRRTEEDREQRETVAYYSRSDVSTLSVIVHIFVASVLSLTRMADVQLSPYEASKSQFRLFVEIVEFGQSIARIPSRSACSRDFTTRIHVHDQSLPPSASLREYNQLPVRIVRNKHRDQAIVR